MSNPPRGNPYVEQYLLLSIRDELRALMLLLRYQWYMVVLCLLGFAALVYQLRPIPPRPVKDIDMVATTTTLLVRQDLHHSIQNLLLSISKEIYSQERYFFDRPSGFPGFVDKQTPRSAIAEKFYSRGPPFLTGKVPYWVTSFIDLAWVNLTLLVFIYPLLRLIPSYRTYVFRIFTSAVYAQVFDLEKKLAAANSEGELRSLRDRVKSIDERVRNVWTPRGTKEAYGLMINAHKLLIERANSRFEKFNIPLLE